MLRQSLFKLTVLQVKICDKILIRSLSTGENNRSIDIANCFSYTNDSGYIRHSPYEQIKVPNIPLHEYVWKKLPLWEDKIAMVCATTDRKYTYAQLRDYCRAFAVRLQTVFQLYHKDVVAVCLPNLPEFPIAVLGAVESGLVVTTVNPIYTADEIAKQLINSKAKLIIGTVENFKVLKTARKLAKNNCEIICVKTNTEQSIPNGAIDFYQLIDTTNIDFNNFKSFNMKPNDLVFLPYSSGTTGLPKGVMLSHNNITSNCEQIQVNLPHTPLILPTSASFQDVAPNVLPFFHIYGLTVCLLSKLSLGCKIPTLTKFQPNVFMNTISEHKATILHLVPPILLYLANCSDVSCQHLENIRTIMSGAAPIGALDAERLFNKIPHVEFFQGYGLTETSPVVLMNMKGNKNYGSIGAPTPNTNVKIIQNEQNTIGLGPNKKGELLIQGPQCMLGYWDNTESTKQTIIDHNWLRTGDMAYYDTNGYFYITERLKELIKVKGFQVAPAELEEILRAHGKVADAAVIGIPHPISGEVPRAFIVKKPNVNDCCENELKEFVANKVSDYKRLDGGIQFIDYIPKNAAGKILRKDIKMKYC